MRYRARAFVAQVRTPAVLRFLLLLPVLPAPFALGAAPVWAWATVSAWVCVLVVVWAAGAAAGRTAVAAWPLPRIAVGLLVALAGFAVWQVTAGWPVHPLRRELAGLSGQAVLASPVLDRAEALDAILRIAGPVLLALLAARLWAGRSIRPALGALATAGAAVAGYGLAAHALGWTGPLALVGGSGYAGATGPFVARGAFAGTCALAMLAAGALWLTRDVDDPPALDWLLPSAWALAGAALLASQSRLGFAAAGAGHLVLLLCALRGGWLSARAAGLSALVLAILGGLGAGLAGLDGRLAAAAGDLPHRLAIWQAGVAALVDRPWLGHGLGSFPQVYELYRPAGAAQPVASAHSGPLEWAVELGVPAALAWLAVLASVAWAAVRLPRGSTGAVLAPPVLVLLAVQGTLDFAPQVPAFALWIALALGLALAPRAGARDHGRAP
jgi:O-antigen ligase